MGFVLNETLGYFTNVGVDIMAFDDIYPEGHQSGVSLIMHGNRVATNGDIRFEPTPGQWQPVPKQGERKLNTEENTITTKLSYPDHDKHLKGFNPLVYPSYEFDYSVKVKGDDTGVKITVELNEAIPAEYVGKICFNLELFPGALMGKPWMMDGKAGFFPHQPNGPVLTRPSNYKNDVMNYNPQIADDLIAEPYAVGKSFIVRPDDPLNCFRIDGKNLKLYDGRMNHNNGWFVISEEFPANETVLEWEITPHVEKNWYYNPVIQTSQVGYHPNQPKVAIIELDKRESRKELLALYKITENGLRKAHSADGDDWGNFLRYKYLKFDFSDIKEEGLYKVVYGKSESSIFRIASDVYDRGVWQPVLEYFLPVQMCHMRVNEKYRVWHGLCHNNDAKMAPINLNHFDGYVQGDSTLTKYNPGDSIPGLNVGGWHDAGDFDLRIESQSEEVYVLTMAYEAFNVNHDTTTINQETKITEIHQPDGKNDILQQIEHGMLSIIGAYYALGRLYRGIICSSLRQYVVLGDSASDDDRWVFTENNPPRELTAAAHIAAASRALKGFNDELSEKALQAAREIFKVTVVVEDSKQSKIAKLHAATELFLTTNEDVYKDYLLAQQATIIEEIANVGWFIARAERKIKNAAFTKAFALSLMELKNKFVSDSKETPYGIPYRPHIWGGGWNIQMQGYRYYFLHKAYPEVFSRDMIFSALNFILGCHPGSNNVSFASGVGARSATVGYGLNRADWSYIPGGVVSGTALIRPDFPELLEFPYLWQQVEYVIGGGSSHYMFLVLAVIDILK